MRVGRCCRGEKVKKTPIEGCALSNASYKGLSPNTEALVVILFLLFYPLCPCFFLFSSLSSLSRQQPRQSSPHEFTLYPWTNSNTILWVMITVLYPLLISTRRSRTLPITSRTIPRWGPIQFLNTPPSRVRISFILHYLVSFSSDNPLSIQVKWIFTSREFSSITTSR
jgi:hypothetical protein